MIETDELIYETDTEFGHYQVVDMVYLGRKARVLFSGRRAAAQSGIPKDGSAQMLFDYNQRFMELVDSLKPKNILLIGGGAFTLPMEILKTQAATKLDVVELDPELKKIAERFFGLKPNKRLKIIIGDGREYLRTNSKKYDLILIDAFTHSVIPRTLMTKEFVQLLEQSLTKSGVTATNIISAYHGPHDTVLKHHFATYKAVFKHVDVFPADRVLSYWISQNFIQASTNKLLKPKYNLRFESLKPPLINTDDIQYD